ncbi:translation initiation factor 2 [Paenibacillus sp. GXUN7292]|uniref:translation initiation factor 2 n=1 Tax=Paenibacillus sp. GXUN7292 TaxID=3422499 RepID=UPI003D7C9CF1
MNRNNNDLDQLDKDILIARIAFIGSSITLLGDGLSAVAAGLALEVLENPSETRFQNHTLQIDSTQKQLDYYINELIKIRKVIR